MPATSGLTTDTASRRPVDWREGRRRRAWELEEQGWPQRAIARALGVTEGAVGQWCQRAGERGAEALHRRVAPGSSPTPPPEQLARLPADLARGAEAYGVVGEVWTTRRVAAVIERVCGVRHHPAHVSRLLPALRWTPQQPVRRAAQRDEAAIAAWRDERWPALRAKPRRRGGRSSG